MMLTKVQQANDVLRIGKPVEYNESQHAGTLVHRIDAQAQDWYTLGVRSEKGGSSGFPKNIKNR